MVRAWNLRVAVVTVMMVFGSGALAQIAGNSQSGNGDGLTPPGTLSFSEEKGLPQMREEEKLAGDVYLFLYDRRPQPIFLNIANSEQRHMDAVLNLLNQYGFDDPASGLGEGEFDDPALQDLYAQLTESGKLSLADALKVGATVEDLDIYDLRLLLAETGHQHITRVYLNLSKGYRNHLRSFVRQL